MILTAEIEANVECRDPAPMILPMILTLTSPLPSPDSVYSPGAWDGSQGSIRLTMLSGSATVESFRLDSIHPGSGGLGIYLKTIVPIPEPSALRLVGLSLVPTLFWAWLTKGHASLGRSNSCHPARTSPKCGVDQWSRRQGSAPNISCSRPTSKRLVNS